MSYDFSEMAREGLKEEGKGNVERLARSYDSELVKTAASALIYMLSDKQRADLIRDEMIATGYLENPSEETYNELAASLNSLKNPVSNDQVMSFAHGLYTVLRLIFKTVTGSIDQQREGLKLEPIPEAEVKLAEKAWFQNVLNVTFAMSKGDAQTFIFPKGSFDGN